MKTNRLAATATLGFAAAFAANPICPDPRRRLRHRRAELSPFGADPDPVSAGPNAFRKTAAQATSNRRQGQRRATDHGRRWLRNGGND